MVAGVSACVRHSTAAGVMIRGAFIDAQPPDIV
jgi:hypothetical protein